jgi:hypothetical protein
MGSGESPQLFARSIADLLQSISYLCGSMEVRAIGLSGVREGLVVTDCSENFVWASANSPEAADPFSSLGPKAGSMTSLQGAVAGLLTGEYAMCNSEAAGIGLAMRLEKTRGHPGVHILDQGKPAGLVRQTHVPVFLVGYDEQVAVFGCDLPARGDLQLNAATFWGLVTCHEVPESSTSIRRVEAVPPLPGYAAIVFPFWGEVAWTLLTTRKLPSPFPAKIRNAFTWLPDSRDVEMDDVLKDMRRRLSDAIAELQPASDSMYQRIVITGGGAAARYRPMMSELLAQSWDVSYMHDDPTVSGIIKAVQLFCLD